MNIHPGDRFGRWTVLDDFILTEKGERKCLCRCDCGTERYVLERGLRYGSSRSCGCLRKEEARSAVAHVLTGRVFGDLTVLGPSADPHNSGGLWWRCRCSCGREVEYPGTLLTTGKRTHCGCRREKKSRTVDITGQVFGGLTALYATERRGPRGSVIWHCRCECGAELDITYNDLVYGSRQSCGCRKTEHEQHLGRYLTHIAGTSLDAIASKKLPSDNTTGHKGVYLVRGKYVAKIVFQKKAYYLGTYDSIDDAADARRKAEERLFASTVAYHTRWQQKAAGDPEWAAQNPIRIHVKAEKGALQVDFSPEL